MIFVPFMLGQLPLLIAIWAIDSYCFALLLRGALTPFARQGPAAVTLDRLRELTDGLVDWTRTALEARRRGRLPAWAPWGAVIFGMLALRQILVLLLACLRGQLLTGGG